MKWLNNELVRDYESSWSFTEILEGINFRNDVNGCKKATLSKKATVTVSNVHRGANHEIYM